MHSSTFLTAAFASLALASPLFHLTPRDLEYDITTVTETITVFDLGYTTVTDFPSSTLKVSTIVTSTETQTVTPSPPAASSSAVVSSPAAASSTVVVTSTISSSEAASTPASSSVAAPTTEAAAPAATSSTYAAPVSSVAAASSSEVASSSSASAAIASPTDFESTVLYHHNIHRANHSAPSMTYDDELASVASTIAASCTFAHQMGLDGLSYGQNIADYGSTGDVESLGEEAMIAQSISDYWYNGEVNLFLDSYYGEATPDMTNFEAWGHFTQVVWVASTKVGCAVQYCEAGTLFSGMAGWYSVCNYGSEGNVEGEFADNVLEPLGEATVSA